MSGTDETTCDNCGVTQSEGPTWGWHNVMIHRGTGENSYVFCSDECRRQKYRELGLSMIQRKVKPGTEQ